MLQIFEDNKCPKWIMKKCLSNTRTINRSNSEEVVYGTYKMDLPEKVVMFYYVTTVNNLSQINKVIDVLVL